MVKYCCLLEYYHWNFINANDIYAEFCYQLSSETFFNILNFRVVYYSWIILVFKIFFTKICLCVVILISDTIKYY